MEGDDKLTGLKLKVGDVYWVAGNGPMKIVELPDPQALSQ